MRYNEVERRLAALERLETEQPSADTLSWADAWLEDHPWVEGRDEELFTVALLDQYRAVLDPWYWHNRYYGPNAVPKPPQERGTCEAAGCWSDLTRSTSNPERAEAQLCGVKDWRDAMFAMDHPDAPEFAAFVAWVEQVVRNGLELYMGDGQHRWTPGGRRPT